MSIRIGDVIQVIGNDGLKLLIDAWGGRRLYIPERIDRYHPIAIRLGLPMAMLLSKAFPREYLDLPSRRRKHLQSRNRAIMSEYRAGVSKSQLAVSYGLTRQQIHNIVTQEADRNG